MPQRILRDGILSSWRVNELTWPEEVFYRRLMSVVDDYGRFHAHPSLIRAACYPLKLEKVADSDIEKWLTACVNAALVRVYLAEGGKRFLEMYDFGQRIQSKSKFPDPTGGSPESTVSHGEKPESTGINRLVVVGDVVEDEGVKPPRKRGTSPKKSIPADFGISERVRKWADSKGFGQLEAHFEAFVGKAKAKGYAYADWDEGFMGAVREDWAGLRSGQQPQTRQRVDL